MLEVMQGKVNVQTAQRSLSRDEMELYRIKPTVNLHNLLLLYIIIGQVISF